MIIGAGLLAAGVLGAFLLLPRSAVVGGYALRLLDGESSESLAPREIGQMVGESRIGATLAEDTALAESCVAISRQDSIRLLACGPIGPLQPADVTTTQLVTFADALMRDTAGGGAVTIASSDQTLAEHRATLLTDGVTVLDFVSFRAMGAEAEVPGLFIERASQAEWLGYATGTDGMYLIWATAPTRSALEAVIAR
jgi:hypothetical protein